ncbi:MAG: hypothetical protein IPG53_15610 [Ignavibacteriales bacterium]|nr:hypothetical protein [Ignavibacteriales bacterium]
MTKLFSSILKTLIIFFFIVSNLPGQAGQNYSITNYNIGSGLESNRINGLTQDTSGRIWLATGAGVSVYDAFSWENINLPDSNNFSGYKAIVTDAHGTIWVAPFYLRSKLFTLKNNVWSEIPNPDVTGIGSETVTGFSVFYHNNSPVVVLSTFSDLFFMVKGKWTRLNNSNSKIPTSIYGITVYREQVYLATSEGVTQISFEDGTTPLIQNGLFGVDEKVWAVTITEDSPGKPRFFLLSRTWFADVINSSVQKYSLPANIEFMALFLNFFIVEDADKKIYMGNKVIKFCFDRKSEKFETFGKNKGFASEGGTFVFLDSEHNIWFADYRGVDKVTYHPFTNYFKSSGMLEDEVTAIVEFEPGNFIFGHNSGFTLYKNRIFTPVNFQRNDRSSDIVARVLDLVVDDEGNIWAAAGFYGLIKISRDGSYTEVATVNGSVTALAYSKDFGLLVASSNGVFSFNNGKLEEFDPKTKLKNFRKIYIFNDKVYLTSQLGIFQLLDGKIIPLVKDKNPLVSSTFSLLQEEDGSLLVGAETGLYSFKDGELTKFVKNGFSISRSVYFIIKSKQKNYWFGTIDGLTRWDGSSTIYNYSVDDGLSGYEMNRSAAVIDAENKLWIGTNTGLSSYSIGIERKAIPSPRLSLSTIETNAGNFYDLNKANYIPYDENTLQFTVRGISFRNENTIEYRIKLEGFDKDFYTLKQAQLYSIRYPNLPSGEYKLVVMAKNRLSVWSNPVFSESIIIEKPFYLKLWFMFFATVIFIILYLLVHKFLLTHREQARLETMVNKRTKELAESELKLKHTLDGLEEEVKQRTLELDNLNRTKDKIFSIISHDLRSPFMSILGFSEILEDELDEMDKKEIRSTVEKILVSSRNTVSLVDGRLEWSRLQIGGLVPEHKDVNVAKVIHVVLELFHPQITKKNIILSSQIEEDIHVFTDENIVKSVVSNLLSNAIKFTNPEGNILVSANKSGEEIILIVEDSGIGMNSEMVEKLFTLTGIKSRKGTANEKGTGLGMNITHDLLKKTGGDIKVESSPGEGTKFTVTFRNSD